MLTTYDWHGVYGHPDHVKVYEVGARAGELAATPAIFEATMNRDTAIRALQAQRDAAIAAGTDQKTTSSIRPVLPTTATRSGCPRPS